MSGLDGQISVTILTQNSSLKRGEHFYWTGRNVVTIYCLSIKRCTHFAWGNNFFWVKDMRGASVVQTADQTTPICGFNFHSCK